MRRIQTQYLKEWYLKNNRKPLMVRGARQVGKSTLVRLFAKELNLDLIEINLEKNKLRSLEFQNEKLVVSILQEIESKFNKKIHEKTLIFFDEIQQLPELIPALRFFYEERPDLAVVCAGSLLEFVLEEHEFSMPVGRIEFLYLGPMKFSEFLMNGEKEELFNQVQNKFPKITSSHYEQLTEQLKKYFFIGGMPEAIKNYYETHSPKAVRDVHHSIIATYKNDFTKYTKNKELPRIEEVFEALPNNFGKKIKYTEISAALDSRKIKRSLHLLALAHLIQICYHSNSSGIPISSQKDINVFKLYFLDIGLLHYMFGLGWSDINNLDNKSLLTQGVSAEQFIAQHLAYRNGPQEAPELYYWLRDKNAANAEVDFIISKGRSIIPIEIKSGKSGSIKSLIQFMGEKKYLEAYRFDLRDRAAFGENFIEDIKIKIADTENKFTEFKLINSHLGLIECLDSNIHRDDGRF